MAKPNRRIDHTGQFRTEYEHNRMIILRTQEICGICGQPIDKKIKAPHPLSATVDHIIPISKGGHPSDLQNLQIAHRWCNRAKSNRLFLETREATDLETVEVNNDDLPLHRDWMSYRPT